MAGEWIMEQNIIKGYIGREKSLEIPEGVTEIGDGAFAGCDFLEEIRFPRSLQVVGERAFENCTALREVNLPYGVCSVGHYAFRGCTGLERVAFPRRDIRLGHSLFYGAAPRFRVTYVGPSYRFRDLTKVVLHREVQSEGDYHHPSGSHFSVTEIHTCGHLFGSAADGDFLCEVYCQEDRQTLQYPARKEQIWTEQC